MFHRLLRVYLSRTLRFLRTNEKTISTATLAHARHLPEAIFSRIRDETNMGCSVFSIISSSDQRGNLE